MTHTIKKQNQGLIALTHQPLAFGLSWKKGNGHLKTTNKMASIEELFHHAANPERTNLSKLSDLRPPPPSFAEEIKKRSENVKINRDRSPSRSSGRSSHSHGSRGSRSSTRSRRRSRRKRSRSRSRSSSRHSRPKRRRHHDSQTEHFDDIESTDNLNHAFHRSQEEMEAEKMSMFAELKRIAPDQSLWTNPKISMASSHEIISMELTIQKQNIDEDQKVFIARLLLGAACRGVEWGSTKLYSKLNGKFLQLQGWAASIMADTAQYDPILRRCYRKMFPQGMGKADPFIELAMALGISAVTYGLINRTMNQPGLGPNMGAASTAVPSNANAFMDRNTPTPAQARAQAQQKRAQPQQGGGFMQNILGALGGGGANNPLSSILGMMQNGGLGNFMQGVQQSMNRQETPDDPFAMNDVSDDVGIDMNPVEQMRRDAQAHQSKRPDPFQRPVRGPASQTSSKGPPPPFNERTGRFQTKSNMRKPAPRIPSPVFGEASQPQKQGEVTMDGPDEDDFKGEDNQSIYENASMQTMDCDSSDGEDVSNVD